MWFIIPYYRKIFIFAVLERWLIHFNKTECSFVYLIVILAAIVYIIPAPAVASVPCVTSQYCIPYPLHHISSHQPEPPAPSSVT